MKFSGVGGFSLPGGEALGCAVGRFGLGTAAHITCERERQGDVAQLCLLMGWKEEQERGRGLEKRDSACFYMVSLMLPDRRERYGDSGWSLTFFLVEFW